MWMGQPQNTRNPWKVFNMQSKQSEGLRGTSCGGRCSSELVTELWGRQTQLPAVGTGPELGSDTGLCAGGCRGPRGGAGGCWGRCSGPLAGARLSRAPPIAFLLQVSGCCRGWGSPECRRAAPQPPPCSDAAADLPFGPKQHTPHTQKKKKKKKKP